MTPQEIFEYKMRWAPGIPVSIHSDHHVQAKDWCRKNIGRHQWSMETYTDVYEHTFRFEQPHHANKFKEYFFVEN
jgi:hypothetical protein